MLRAVNVLAMALGWLQILVVLTWGAGLAFYHRRERWEARKERQRRPRLVA